VVGLLSCVMDRFEKLVKSDHAIFKEVLYTLSKAILTTANSPGAKDYTAMGILFKRLQSYMPFEFGVESSDADDCLEAMGEALAFSVDDDGWLALQVDKEVCHSMLAGNMRVLLIRSLMHYSQIRRGFAYYVFFPEALQRLLQVMIACGNYHDDGSVMTMGSEWCFPP
jgi:hypothetical protein